MIAQLSSDDSTPGLVDATNTIAATAIERASGMLEAYALRGGRYSLTDLGDLQTADDWTLKSMVAVMAMVNLYRRRGSALPEDLKEQNTEVKALLESLEKGKIIFPQDDSSISAGTPETKIVPTGRRAELGMVSDEPFFPMRRSN